MWCIWPKGLNGWLLESESGSENEGKANVSCRWWGEREGDEMRWKWNWTSVVGCIQCLTKYMWMDYILQAMRCPCGTVQKQTVAVHTVGNLGVCLCTVEHGGQVGADLQRTLSISPNPGRIDWVHCIIYTLGMDLIVDETCIALAMDRQIMMVSLGASHPGKYEKMDNVGVCGNPGLYHVVGQW